MTAPKLDLAALRKLEQAAIQNWHLDHDSDLTMDGKSTPRIGGQNSDGSFLTFARGNRNYGVEAELAVAARNALPALLDARNAAPAMGWASSSSATFLPRKPPSRSLPGER